MNTQTYQSIYTTFDSVSILVAARSLADLLLGFCCTSRSDGTTIFLFHGCQPFSSTWLSSSALEASFAIRIFCLTDKFLASSKSILWKCRLTILSSREWKLIATQRPPVRRQRWADSSALWSSLSSLLTKIRSAWKTRVAGWLYRPSLSWRTILQ